MKGKSLSHYRIVDKLGEGGMGVVWKAVDTKLERDVAIKALPEDFLQDRERISRFEREAKVLASLNHRNIASIYGIEEAEGQRFLIMELVDGEDLATKLLGGPLPVDESIDLCHQLARALEAAHEGGVLHRDLKPANVRVTHEGRVKVLDFGLAKSLQSDERGSDPSSFPTRTSADTRAGVILGTAAYMSPEQARGKLVDKRTDIWAFGCVLFECLTGRSPFRGETMTDTMASILKTAPDWSLLPGDTPARVRELLQRCLEKDSRNRLRDIGDARLELQRSITGHESLVDVSGVTAGIAPDLRAPRSFSTAALAAALVAGLAIGAGLWGLAGAITEPSASGTRGVTRLSVSYPKDHLIGDTQMTPDGKAIVFGAIPEHAADLQGDLGRLYIRRFDRYEAEKISGSDGVNGFCLSPDGRWLAMLVPVSPRSSKRRLSKVPIDGSTPPLAILEWPENWAGPLQWLPDGDLLAMIQGEPRSFVRIPTDGHPVKDPVEIRNAGFTGDFRYDIENEAVLPDGIHVLGSVTTYTERGFEISIGVMNANTGEARLLIDNGSQPRWSPTGHLLFSRNDTLLAVPFDPVKLTPTGAQVAITNGLRADSIWQDANFRLAPSGTLLHWPGGVVGGSRKLLFLSPEFEMAGSWSDDRRPFEASVKVSPDGRRLAVTMVNPEGLYDIWVSDMDRPRLSQIVKEQRRDCQPQLWSRDGAHLIYVCGDTSGNVLYRIAGDGTGEPEELISVGPQEGYGADDFLPDGSGIILTHSSQGKAQLVLMRLDAGSREPALLLDDAANARVSPDGHWLTYSSDRSGRGEVYLRRFNTDASLGPEIPISTDGGGGPEWHRGADAAPLEIRYGNQFEIRSVTVTAGARVNTSEPKFVADLSEMIRKFGGAADALPDGRTIAIMRGDDEKPPTEANVVLNWFDELEESLGENR